MAELALAGTVVGLIATGAHLVVKVANFVDAVGDAPESILDVQGELRNVKEILKEIQEPLQSKNDHLSDSLVKRIDAVTKDCTRTFSALNKLIDKLGPPRSKRRKFLFAFYAENINSARTSLQAQKASLTLVLQLVLR